MPIKLISSTADPKFKLKRVSNSGRTVSSLSGPVSNDALIAWYDAKNSTSYPGYGSIWYNLVDTSKFQGQINGATFVNDYTGGKFFFDGNDRVLIGQPLLTGTSYTVESWINFALVDANSRNIVSSQDSPFWFASGMMYAGVGGNYTAVGDSGPFQTNVWKHVAVTFNDTLNTMVLYKDGVAISTNTNVTQTYVSQDTYIGSHFYGGNPVSFFSGSIASVKIYNYARTPAQISSSYADSSGSFVSPTPTPTP
jgi:hypothetical protein